MTRAAVDRDAVHLTDVAGAAPGRALGRARGAPRARPMGAQSGEFGAL
jgi:hypothetical protein